MLPQWIIEKKRDGGALEENEIRFFIAGYTCGDIPDYQMAALAMAILLRGMTTEETAVLTDAMLRSGDQLDTSSVPGVKVDKHSTGGIGDKVSLVLAPWLACCGVAVPMIAGRGLGLTGGTLDKLESIPGFRTDLDEQAFLRVVQECGCAIVGQTARLAPADRKLYALRDVTGTVPSIPLITASIMSKKLAEGIDHLVLDVKAGCGAFMKTRADARALADSLCRTARAMGKGVCALITDMNHPLGRAAGNALEVIEAVDALQGRGPADLMEVTRALGVDALLLAGAVDPAAARAALEKALASGAAFERFQRMIARQGGDPAAVERAGRLPTASRRVPCPTPRAGYVQAADAEKIGRAVLLLGAGRARTTDAIDSAVGVAELAAVGERLEAGQPLAVLHVNNRAHLDEAKRLIDEAYVLTDAPVARPSRILERRTGA